VTDKNDKKEEEERNHLTDMIEMMKVIFDNTDHVIENEKSDK